MVRWGMVIDLDKCTACQACVVACRIENNVPTAGMEESAKGRAIFWMELLTDVRGKYPNAVAKFLPRPCMHCENPPCVQVCPVEATYKSEEGQVLQRYERCIGCRYCMVACPYGARFFNWREPSFPETLAEALNPDIIYNPDDGTGTGPNPRFAGIVEKCTFCIQRVTKLKEKAKAEGREIRDDEVLRLTACAQTCTGGAIHFGDLDDPNSTVSQLAKSKRAFRLLEELGTRPQVIYLQEG